MLILPKTCHRLVNSPGITTKAIAILIPINIVKKAIEKEGNPIPDKPFTKPPKKNTIEISINISKLNNLLYFLKINIAFNTF